MPKMLQGIFGLVLLGCGPIAGHAQESDKCDVIRIGQSMAIDTIHLRKVNAEILPDETSPGHSVTGFFDRDILKLAVVEVLGESSRAETRFYFFTDTEFFVERTELYYAGIIGTNGTPPLLSIVKHVFYFCDGALLDTNSAALRGYIVSLVGRLRSELDRANSSVNNF